MNTERKPPGVPEDVVSLVEVLEFRSRTSPDECAFLYLEDGECETERMTYGQLEQASLRLAGLLRQQIEPGERVLVCLPTGLSYIASFFGCLKARALVVPSVAAERGRLERTLTHIMAVIEESGAKTVITDQASLEAFEELAEPGGLGHLKIVLYEDALSAAPLQEDQSPASDDVAYLLFTSGSTGRPKGVVVSHGNVIDNLRNFPGWKHRPPRGFVSWLPYNFDLGLFFTILHPLFQGALSVSMPPIAFVKKPSRWVLALSKYGASVTTGPNFAYDLAVRYTSDGEKREIDLSHVDVALSGGERVRSGTLERFARAFAECGFREEALYPSYGMTEATATISGSFLLEKPRVKHVSRRSLEQGRVSEVPDSSREAERVVGNGVALLGDTQVKVVDPGQRVELEAGEVGEVWLKGPSVTHGYWQLDRESHEAYGGYLENGEGPFFRTGDLAFFDGEHHLYPIGRISDLIILHGVNYYPEVLEPTLCSAHPALRPGFSVALAVELEDEERLVCIQEVRKKSDFAPDAVFRSVREAMDRHHGVEPFVICLVPQGSLAKTQSGKFKRRATRKSYLEGEFEVIAESRRDRDLLPRTYGDAGAVTPAPSPQLTDSAQSVGSSQSTSSSRSMSSSQSTGPAAGRAPEIERWLTDYLRRRSSSDDIDPRRPTMEYGLASIEMVTMIGELSEWLGTFLPPTLAWDHPSPAQLARHIAGQDSEARGGGARPALQSRPVAIVGMACRLPGARDLDEYWQLLVNGVDAVEEIPPERWDVESLFDADPAAPGKMSTRWMGYIPKIEDFDAEFFGISPREADHVDPRQRLALELCHEAFEDAGLRHEDVRGHSIGVFMAVLRSDYDSLLTSDLARLDAFSGAGTQSTVIANRLSYFFDLQGPSLVVDTACSGSLVTIHLACQSIASGECGVAVAGGVNLNQMPGGNIFFSKAGALAVDGRCKTFDHRADGIVRSEGAGILVLKDLERALADGDEIRAVIRGTGVNQDGHSNGLMAPNGASQQELLVDTWRRAGLGTDELQYIEAHGTGTSLGDPIEVNAVAKALAETGYSSPSKVRLGSVKTNLGHTEAAAGVAGVIKTVLSLQRGLLPPTLHFEKPNPLIPFDQLPVEVQTELTGWPRPEERLLAGVSGFGFGGTNAHVVLEAAPTSSSTSREDMRSQLLVLSARSPEARKDTASSVAEALESIDPKLASFHDVCATSALNRSVFEYRMALVAEDAEEAAAKLRRYLGGDEKAVEWSGKVVTRPAKTAFVFSGQGSHWLGMGTGLLDEPIFRRVIEQCDATIHRIAGWSLMDELRQESQEVSRLDDTEITQPAIFAVQAALATLWFSRGIEPDAIAGQSLGEVAAAHAAGALDLEDAVRVVVHRGRLMGLPEARGKTGLIGVPVEEAKGRIRGFEDSIGIAGASSPTATLVSGAEEAMQELFASLEGSGVFARLLQGVSVAFHSPLMDPLVPQLVGSLEGLKPRSATIPLFFAAAAGKVQGEDLGPQYWGENLRCPFLLTEVLKKLRRLRTRVFLEVSPHPVLADPIRQYLEHESYQGRVLRSLRRCPPGSPNTERREFLETLGALFAEGHTVRWHGVFPDRGRRVPLPTYPWQRRRYWYDQIETHGSVPAVAAHQTPVVSSFDHQLLGSASESSVAPFQRFWQRDYFASTLDFLVDHKVQGFTVVAGAMLLEMARAAAFELGAENAELQQIRFAEPLVLSDGQARLVQVSMTPEGKGRWACQVSSRSQDGDSSPWSAHMSAFVDATPLAPQQGSAIKIAKVNAELDQKIDADSHYQLMSEFGLGYGPFFRCVRSVRRREGEALARLSVPEEFVESSLDFSIHPGLLDCAFQATAQTAPPASALLPVSIERFVLGAAAPSRLWTHSLLREVKEGDLHRTTDISLYDEQGQALGRIEGLRLEPMLGGGLTRRASEMLYRIGWNAAPEAEAADPPPTESSPAAPGAETDGQPEATWVVWLDSHGFAEAIAELLSARGDRVIRVMGRGEYSQLEDGRWGLDPSSPQDLDRFFEEAVDERVAPLRGIVYCAGIDSSSVEDMSGASLVSATAEAPQQVLEIYLLLQALFRLKQRRAVQFFTSHESFFSPRLWMVSRGSLGPWADEPETAGQAHLSVCSWIGLSRALLQESPESFGALIDLEYAVEPEISAPRILQELLHGEEDLVALSTDRRLVPRVEPWLKTELTAPNIKPGGAYLITGGLSGLGLKTGSWLAEQGARRLILLGRSVLPERGEWQGLSTDDPAYPKVQAIKSIEALGASVQTAAVDVASATELKQFIDAYRAEARPPIRGVIHSAGVVDDRLIDRSAPDEIARVLRPKVLGAWNLHQHFQDVDFFVMFSSAASWLGTFGQSSYAAGNSFMDALARFRSARAMRTVSIAWGPWAEVGMAARQGLQEQHEREGMRSLSTAQGLELFQRCLGSKEGVVMAMDVNWPVWFQAVVTPTQAFSNFAQSQTRSLDTVGKSGGGKRKELDSLEPEGRKEWMLGFLREVTAGVMRIDPDRVPLERPANELGIDSIMMAEIKQQVDFALGIAVPIMELLSAPNFERIAEGLLTHCDQEPQLMAGREAEVEAGVEIEESLAT